MRSFKKIIVTFIVRIIINTLPTRKNLCRWAISQSSNCSFYLQSETLQHVSSCKSYLDEGRYTWRQRTLLFLANTFSSLASNGQFMLIYPFFLSPCFIIGESCRPDLLLLTDKNILYITLYT